MIKIKKASNRAPIPHFIRTRGTMWDYSTTDQFLPYSFYTFSKFFRFLNKFPSFFIRKSMLFSKNMMSHVKLVCTTRSYISDKSLETLRRFLRRGLGKHVIMRVLVRPFVSRTQKPVGVRMGKGKGRKVCSVLAPLSKGQSIFEIVNVSYPLVIKLASKLNYKLPFSVRVIRIS